MTEGKQNIIAALINEYDIKTADDIQDALKWKFKFGGICQSFYRS